MSVLCLPTHVEHHDAHTTVDHLLMVVFLTQALEHFSNCLPTIFEQNGGQAEGDTSKGGNDDYTSDDDEDKLPIAVDLYPTVALLNHSCDPDLTPFYFGSRLSFKALRQVPEVGSEIFFSYGPTHRRVPLATLVVAVEVSWLQVVQETKWKPK